MEVRAILSAAFRVSRAAMILVVLALLSVTLVVVLASSVWTIEDQRLTATTVNAVIVTVGILMGTLLLALSIAGLISLWRLVWRGRRVFGPGPVEQLIALGIAGVLFPRALQEVLIRPVAVIVWLAGLVPQTIKLALSGSEGADPSSRAYGLNNVFEAALGLIQSMAGQVSRELINNVVWDLPIADIFLGLAVMVLLGQAMSPSSVAFAPGGSTRFGAWLRHLDVPRRRRYGLLMVLLAGGYLSMAAIVTTPWLVEAAPPEGLSPERFQERLQSALLSQEQFDRSYPADPRPPQDPFVAVEQTLQRFRTALDSGTAPRAVKDPWTAYVTGLRSKVTERQRIRSDALDRWTAFRTKVLGQQTKLKDRTLGDFRLETLSPMTTPERTQYFSTLESWFREGLGSLYGGLTRAQEYLRQADFELTSWAEQHNARLQSYLVTLQSDSGARLSTPPLVDFADVGTTRFVDLRVFELPFDAEGRPAPPQPGSAWGPFGWIARWLLATKSLALTLITGMIGFGLLGSAIAAFVRGPVSDAPDQLELGEISGVVVSGFSAALVVFLAVKGSLAVFSTGDQEPDPYVLFFACLVGAVYSKDVWLWARKRFLQSFPGPSPTLSATTSQSGGGSTPASGVEQSGTSA